MGECGTRGWKDWLGMRRHVHEVRGPDPHALKEMRLKEEAREGEREEENEKKVGAVDEGCL